MFGLRRNQTGGARTLAHLQEGPTAKEKGPSERGRPGGGAFSPAAEWQQLGWCTLVWPKGKVSLAEREEQQADCFHSTSENSNRGDGECASCGCGFLVHSLTPY